jgi:hypothetical protein
VQHQQPTASDTSLAHFYGMPATIMHEYALESASSGSDTILTSDGHASLQVMRFHMQTSKTMSVCE